MRIRRAYECNNFSTSFVYSTTATVEALEEKCEELRRQIDELNRELEIERRKNERLQHEQRARKEEAITATVHTFSKQPDVSRTTHLHTCLHAHFMMAATYSDSLFLPIFFLHIVALRTHTRSVE